MDVEKEYKDVEKETETSEKTPESFWKDNRGVGIIEVVLLLVILIGLVLVFKEQITGIVTNAFAKISGDASSILR